jgi:hypothetical protein
MLGQRLLISFLLALNLTSAFAPISPVARQISSSSSTTLRSFEPKPLAEEGDAVKPLESVSTEEGSAAEGGADGESIKAVYKNLARGGELEEVTWVDPAMRANTNPFELSWWAYILFGLPVVLLLDDAFHFIPAEGPLAFLNRL